MKHGATDITYRKCGRNDVITLINNLCQLEVESYERYGTSKTVTNTSLGCGTKLRTKAIQGNELKQYLSSLKTSMLAAFGYRPSNRKWKQHRVKNHYRPEICQ